MSDLIGWVGTCLMVIGSIDIAHKNVRGLWLMLLGNIAFIAVGYLSHLTSLIGVSILMGILDYYGIHKWRTADEDSKETCDRGC